MDEEDTEWWGSGKPPVNHPTCLIRKSRETRGELSLHSAAPKAKDRLSSLRPG